MPLENLLAVLSSADNMIESLNITGGEPLVSNSFPKVFEFASRMTKLRRIGIFTNGMEHEKLFRIFKESGNKNKLYSIQTSLDGTEEIHNKLRGNDRSFSSVISLLDRIKNLQSNLGFTIALDIVMTVSRSNYAYIEKVIDIIGKYNGQCCLNFVRSSNQALLPDDKKSDFTTGGIDLTTEQIKAATKLWVSRAGSYMEDGSFLINKIRMENIIYFLDTGKWRFPCGAGLAEATMLSDGSIAICEMRSPVGNISDYGYNYERFWKAHRVRGFHKCYCMFDCAIAGSVFESWAGRRILFVELLKRYFSRIFHRKTNRLT